MISSLSIDELELLYSRHMRRDFIPAELKPLTRIRNMYRDGAYNVIVQREGQKTLAYACLYHGTAPALLDYYAVVEEHRGQGAGSAFLSELLQSTYIQQGVMAELESPSKAANEAEYEQRQRRVRFYERLGFQPTEVHATIFGVAYEVYAFGAAQANIRQVLYDVYRYFVPDTDLFRQEVHIYGVQ